MDQRSAAREFPFVKELGKYIYQEAKDEGFRAGEVKADREKIFRLAARRGLVLSGEQQSRIRTCEDRQVLDRWFDNAIDASTADDVFR
ncbi:MAG: hypothetical protein IPM54_12050 [Polyangiaceae bacterium]|nr:hypothetical protein [Polyangiaceae bacterium]